MPILQWLNDDQARKASAGVPYRLLTEDPALSYGDPTTQNMLIQGDNLEALKALLPYYAGQVKCIFIDPPYNTGSAFDYYDDNVEHSTWLSLIYPRLELLHELLSEDGSIWITIDDNEGHYLKILMDEIFGRANLVANVVWQKRTSPDNRLRLGAAHDHILVYGKLPLIHKSFNQLATSELRRKAFKNPDNDPRGLWASSDCTAQAGHGTPSQFYALSTPSGRKYEPPPGRCWVITEPEFERLKAEGRLWFGKDGNARPRIKTYLQESGGVNSWTWWPNNEVGHNQEAKKEINVLFGADNAFDTPKPERLLFRILTIATNSGDLVLDSFLGSGTTAAVAHKMGRRYIGIEMGDHAITHCFPRLQKVVDGEQGGASEVVGWTGGGGFRYYTLGETVFDAEGQIKPQVQFTDLAAHVWFLETKMAIPVEIAQRGEASPLLGICDETAYYLLYNGVLGDRRPEGGNVLTSRMLHHLPAFNGPKVIYGEATMMDAESLQQENIIFKHIPYDIKAR